MKLKPTSLVFYTLGGKNNSVPVIEDSVMEDEDGNLFGAYSKKSWAAMGTPEKPMWVGEVEGVVRNIELANTTSPKMIDKSQFIDMLDVLPPVRWVRNAVVETFQISEKITYNITSIYGRIGEVYMTYDGPCNASQQEVEAKFLAFYNQLQSQKVGA